MSKSQTIEAIPATTKFWNITNNDGINAELVLYGDVCSEQPRNFWTGEKIDELYITPKGFLDDLQKIKDAKNITIKLNSAGGDLYTGIAIHNALKSLKSNITVVVEGVAASAASIIMCAGAKVAVHASSLIMIHSVMGIMDGLVTLNDLRTNIEAFETCNNAVAEIYAQKTGLDVNKILKMMESETWMTGKEAIEKGFADELIENDDDLKINIINKNTLFVNGIKINLKSYSIPDNFIKNMQKIETSEKTGGTKEMSDFQKFLANLTKLTAKFTNSEDSDDDDAKKIKEEKENSEEKSEEEKEEDKKEEKQDKKNKTETAAGGTTEKPETNMENSLEKRLIAAIEAERKRCREIDLLPVSTNLKNEAKYGAKPCSAGELAMYVLQKNNPENKAALDALNMDIEKSNSVNVLAMSSTFDNLSDEDEKILKAKEFAAQRKLRKEQTK